MEDLVTENVQDVIDNKKYELYRISQGKFIILCVLTFGLYEIWWTYKAWRYLQLKEKSAINPVLRAFLRIIYQIPLYYKILKTAKSYDYKKSFIPWMLFLGYIFYPISMFFLFPQLINFASILSFIFIIQPFNALNFVMEHCEEVIVPEQKGFNSRQIFLMVFFGLFWLLILLGLVFSKGQ